MQLARQLLLTCLTGAYSPQILIGIDTGVVPVAPFEPHCISPHLLGAGNRHLPRSDGTGHHFEGIVRVRMTRLSTNSAGALFAQQIEGVNTMMPISPLNGHGMIGDMHFNSRRVGFS